MNSAELQFLSLERIQDAQALIRGKRYSFAYYVAGYGVECALKSCLLTRMIHTGWIFQDKVKIDDCLTHDFGKLIRLAGLLDHLNETLAASQAGNGAFAVNWETAGRWKVADRYDAKTKTKAEVTSLLDAIVNEPDGVLPWIKNYW